MVKLIKPRYKYYEETNQLYDNEKDELYAYNLNKNKIISILNQQDKRIKECEEQLSTATMYHGCEALVNELKQKNQQLKEQLHDLPKKIVEEIKKELYSCGKTYLEDEPYIEICIVKGILDRILKKFGWEDDN